MNFVCSYSSSDSHRNNQSSASFYCWGVNMAEHISFLCEEVGNWEDDSGDGEEAGGELIMAGAERGAVRGGTSLG